MTLFAIDAEGRVAGSLTDGDIRRAPYRRQIDGRLSRKCRAHTIPLSECRNSRRG